MVSLHLKDAHILLPNSPEPQQLQPGKWDFILYPPTNLLKQAPPHTTSVLSLSQNWILSLVYHDHHTTRLPHSHSDINPPTRLPASYPHPTPHLSLILSPPTPKPLNTHTPIMMAQYNSVDHNITLPFCRTEHHRQWHTVCSPDDRRKDARNMLRNDWLPIIICCI